MKGLRDRVRIYLKGLTHRDLLLTVQAFITVLAVNKRSSP